MRPSSSATASSSATPSPGPTPRRCPTAAPAPGRSRRCPRRSTSPAPPGSSAVEDWKPANPLGTTGQAGSAIRKDPVNLTLNGLKAWPDIPELANASGVGTYTTTVTLPPSWKPGSSAILRLGQAMDTVRVTVNGQEAGVDQISTTVDVGPYLKVGANTLVVRVATTLNNRLAALFPAVATRGHVQANGLVGPVVLTPYGEAAVYSRTDTPGTVGGTVPATLSLALGTPASFGAFTPGVDRTYDASTTATVTSTAGDATLSVTDPSTTATGRLVNGSFALSEPLQVRANAGAFAPLGSGPLALLQYGRPVSNDAVSIAFRQHIGSTQALRTGAYGKTLTFTLSTTNP